MTAHSSEPLVNPWDARENLVMMCPSGKLRLRHRKTRQIDLTVINRRRPPRPRPIILSRRASAGLVNHGDGEIE